MHSAKCCAEVVASLCNTVVNPTFTCRLPTIYLPWPTRDAKSVMRRREMNRRDRAIFAREMTNGSHTRQFEVKEVATSSQEVWFACAG